MTTTQVILEWASKHIDIMLAKSFDQIDVFFYYHQAPLSVALTPFPRNIRRRRGPGPGALDVCDGGAHGGRAPRSLPLRAATVEQWGR